MLTEEADRRWKDASGKAGRRMGRGYMGKWERGLRDGGGGAGEVRGLGREQQGVVDDAVLFGVWCCMWTVKGEMEPGSLGVGGGEVKIEEMATFHTMYSVAAPGSVFLTKLPHLPRLKDGK